MAKSDIVAELIENSQHTHMQIGSFCSLMFNNSGRTTIIVVFRGKNSIHQKLSPRQILYFKLYSARSSF